VQGVVRERHPICWDFKNATGTDFINRYYLYRWGVPNIPTFSIKMD